MRARVAVVARLGDLKEWPPLQCFAFGTGTRQQDGAE